MRRILVFAIVGFVGATATLIAYVRARGIREGADAERFVHTQRGDGPLPVLWRAPDFASPDHENRTTSLRGLAGAPFIVDFIFTRCTNVCPMMSARMMMLARRLHDTDVAFVSFSVDPEHDTPEVLAEYAERWSLDGARWSLVATSPDSLRTLVAGFRVTAEPTSDPEDPILHSNVFFLVDAEGQVRGVYSSDDEAELASLVADARALAHPVRGAADIAADTGYAALGCGGCHDNPRIAPSLDALGGARVLADATAVDADDAYLRRAILEPQAQLVAGYLPIMPSYRGVLSDAELDALVAELRARARGGTPAPPEPPVAIVIDPVCHMQVRAEAETPHLEHEGAAVYFCAEVCRDAFREHPERYPLEAPG